ncbi:FlgD immunoglobulin-like domain containing protein [Coraliomargarita parva]|uniref:FlgD immunoglobulin-like domain containing protein n=1 Tax=Coraliomargarita parva TaxID=3014050 RepID=UPI0022B471EC|nr:FlgD immunoglobulin-like domain containing protein [Coraliomargarita parva]
MTRLHIFLPPLKAYAIFAWILLSGLPSYLQGQTVPEGYREASLNGRTVFGLDPAWLDGREFEKVFDSDADSFYDYLYGADSTCFVGIDFGEAIQAAEIHFTPRSARESRMVGGLFQGSNESSVSGYETIYEVTAQPARTDHVIAVVTSQSYRYYRYLAPIGSYGSIAEFDIVPVESSSSETTTDTATDTTTDTTTDTATDTTVEAPQGYTELDYDGRLIFGLEPAYAAGREFDKAFDGDATTFYDYIYSDAEPFIGFDHGSAAQPAIFQYTPREGYPARLVGGLLQGSNEGPYSGYVTLYEITEVPEEVAQEVVLSIEDTYRYYRYLAPNGSHGSIAEFDVIMADDSSLTTEEETSTSEPEVTPVEPEQPVVDEGTHRDDELDGVAVFGMDPSWRDSNDFEAALDGDPTTYYDFRYSTKESYVGIDLGAAVVPSAIRFTPRKGWAIRMIGGQFQGSNESSTSGFETLHLINYFPVDGEQVVEFAAAEAYRYYRYLAPAGSNGNIAEFAVDVVDAGSEDEVAVTEPDTGTGTDTGGSSSSDPVEPDTTVPTNSSVTVADDGTNSFNVEISLDAAGQVSAAVYDADEHLVKTLLQGEALEAGTHQLVWDGLDRDGNTVATGDYTLKVLRSDGLTAEFVTNLGVNPDSAPYDFWVGNHQGGASSIAIDSTGMYVAAEKTETAPVLLKQSLDGTVRYWTKERGDVTNGRYQGGTAMASDQNGTLYMLQQNGYLQVIDGDDGSLEASWDVLPSDLTRDLFIYQNTMDEVSGADLAAYGNTIVISYRDHNKVSWLNPANGSIVKEMTFTAPRGVAVGSDGEVLVISDNKVYSYLNGTVTTVIASGLNNPQRLSIDASSDTILVTEGVRASQVKRFDRSGNLLASYGDADGRAFGTYNGENFNGVRDIEADAEGGFVVVEPQVPPRRVAHFYADGSLRNEWIGGADYYAWAEPDPRDPEKAWVFTGDGLILSQIDFDTGKWSILETWLPEEMVGGLIVQPKGQYGRWRVLYNGTQRYLVCEDTAQVFAHSDGDLRAVSISTNDSDTIAIAKEIAGYTGSVYSFRWLDGNGDGEPQASEFTFSNIGNAPWPRNVNEDFSLIGYDRPDTAFNVVKTDVMWSTYGPYYPIARESGLNVVVASKTISSRAGVRGSGAYQSPDGNFYAHYHLEGEEHHGAAWPTNWAGESRFVKWSESGEELWSVSRHAYHGGLAGGPGSTSYVKTPAGQLHVPVKVIGETADCVVLADRVETPGMAWSKDGLYVGSVLDHRTEDGLPDIVYSWWQTDQGEESIMTSDNANGGSLIEYEDGTVLWYTQGRNNVPVYKVTGWDKVVRFETSFSLNGPATVAEAAGTGLVARYYNGEFEGSALLTRTETQIWHGVSGVDDVVDGPDGPAYSWASGPAAGTSGNFSVRWKGQVEAPLSEDFTFSVYNRGRTRMWINGQQIIFSWNDLIGRTESEPVRLVAGERYDIQIDFYSNESSPAISLNWESVSLDRKRIPSAYLYAVDTASTHEQLRDATDYIDSATFDMESGDIESGMIDNFSVSGYRQRSMGKTGAWLGYENINFSTGLSLGHMMARGYPSGTAVFPVKLAVRLDSPNGTTIAEFSLSSEVETHTVDLSAVSGVHDIYVVNTTSTEWHYMDFRWLRFE